MVAGPAGIIGWTSSYSETGAVGAPELAIADKGQRAFDHAVDQLAAFVRWLRGRPILDRREHHASPPSCALPFEF